MSPISRDCSFEANQSRAIPQGVQLREVRTSTMTAFPSEPSSILRVVQSSHLILRVRVQSSAERVKKGE